MIFKTKHIASQFLTLIAIYISIIGLFALVVLFSYKKKEVVNTATKISENTSVELENLGQLVQLAVYQQKTESDFVQVQSDKLIISNRNLVNDLIDSLILLHEINYLNRKLKKSLVLDSLVANINKYSHSFDLYVYSLKEKGNKYGGITGVVNKISKQLFAELKTVPDSGKKESEFNELISTYFNSYDIGSLQSIVYFCQNISSSFYEYEDFDPYSIEQLSLDLSKYLTDIENINKRLDGSIVYHGQIKDVEKNLGSCLYYMHELKTNIEKASNSYQRMWNSIIIIFALSIILIILFSLWNFSNRTGRSLSKLLLTSESFAKGNIKQKISTDRNAEFDSIAQFLLKHNDQLYTRTNFITELVEDKLDKDIEILSKQDELGISLNKLKDKLLNARNEQDDRTKENEIRRYINEGLAKFGEIMRVNSNDTVALGDILIKNLTKYLGALQGTIFLLDEESSDELNLIAAFAFDRKKYLSKTIKSGEGLIGTCANEKKTIYLKKVPDEYTTITSGLGDAPPNKVLIVPVMHEKNLVGVIELASLNEIKPYEIDLTEKIASSLASSIITVRNNTKTAKLLEKSQQQAAEMAEQEEEMRQNMEELKATQEESARREEEMQGILDAIGSSFYILEYDDRGQIVHANEQVINFLELPYESIIGKRHNEVFSSDSILNEEFFAQVVINKSNSKVSEVLSWGKNKYTFTYAISPILSRYEEVIKILNLVTIEEYKEQ